MLWMPRPVEGKHYRFRNQIYWAQEGMVILEDRNSGEIKVLTWRDILGRAKAFNGQVKVMHYTDERNEMIRCVENLIACAREAKDQGDPTQPEICRQKIKEQRRGVFSMSSLGSDAYLVGTRGVKAYFLQSEPFKNMII